MGYDRDVANQMATDREAATVRKEEELKKRPAHERGKPVCFCAKCCEL